MRRETIETSSQTASMLKPRTRSGCLRASGRAFPQISKRYSEQTAFRRDFHLDSELGFEEVYSENRVANALSLCSADEVHTGIAKTGMVAVAKGKKDLNPNDAAAPLMVGLRADMDALSMTEHKDVG